MGKIRLNWHIAISGIKHSRILGRLSLVVDMVIGNIDPPDGNTAYRQYALPGWALVSAVVVLFTLAMGFLLAISVDFPLGSPIKFIVVFGFGLTTSLFAHESLDYLTNSKLGYDPVYLWPNHVYVPNAPIETRDIILILLAPQLLSVIYAFLLLSGIDSWLQLMVSLSLIFNLTGGCSDVTWVLRRLTWPKGTKVIVTENQETYVSFPKK